MLTINLQRAKRNKTSAACGRLKTKIRKSLPGNTCFSPFVPRRRYENTLGLFSRKQSLKLHQPTGGFASCPLRRSIAEKGRVPPQKLQRGQRDTPRGTVRLSPSTINSRHAVRRAPTARTRTSYEWTKIPVHVLATCRKHMTPSTENCSGWCSHASAYQKMC